MAAAVVDGETTVYRIFRHRHLNGAPPKTADQWIRKVKERCTSLKGEIEVTAIQTDLDEGSLLVAITRRGIIALEEAEQVI